MNDEIRVTADRRREVTVGPARKPGVTEVPRVVASLLERAEDERRERFPAAARLLGVFGDALAHAGGELRRLDRSQLLGHRWRRHLELGQLGE